MSRNRGALQHRTNPAQADYLSQYNISSQRLYTDADSRFACYGGTYTKTEIHLYRAMFYIFHGRSLVIQQIIHFLNLNIQV